MKKVIQTTRTDNNNYNKKKNPKEMKKKTKLGIWAKSKY